MLKLLFIPTGNIFTLPDSDVMEITKADRAGNYKILDAGFQEMKQEVVTPETVTELVLQAEEKAQAIEAKDQAKEAKENKIKPKTEYVEPKSDIDFNTLDKKQLIALCHRANIPANKNENKQALLTKLRENGFNVQ